MGEDSEVEIEKPDYRFRPQVPAYIYYTVIYNADDLLPMDAQSVNWWQCLEVVLNEHVGAMDCEATKEFMEGLHEKGPDKLRKDTEEKIRQMKRESIPSFD